MYYLKIFFRINNWLFTLKTLRYERVKFKNNFNFNLFKFYSFFIRNQNFFYIVGFCGFSSFLTELNFSFNENYQLNWPIIEQTKYFRIKSQVYNIILKSLKNVFIQILIWEVIHLIGKKELTYLVQENFLIF